MNTVFHSKIPIKRKKPLPLTASKFKKLAKHIRKNGKLLLKEEKKSGSYIKYEMNGIIVIFDTYYEEKTITISGVGIIHQSMNESSSYFDIDMSALISSERRVFSQHADMAQAS